MRIKSSVKLASGLTLSLLLLYAIFTVFISRTLEGKFHDLRTSSQVRALFDRLQDTNKDYFLYPSDRASQQWQILHVQLLQILNSQVYQGFQKKYHIEDLSDELRLMGEAFNKLTVATRKTRISPSKDRQEFQNRLITQITLTARGIGMSFDNISTQIEKEVLSLQRTSTVIDIIALVLVAAAILGISTFLSKSVVQPVVKLHEGAKIFGQGNLDYRLEPAGPGEIRELSQSFNQMAANLDNLTAALHRSQEDLRYLATQLIVAQEKERQYIGMELHDDFGQLLMVLKLQLREVQRNLEPESITKSKADLENSLKLISEIVDRIRRISRSLRPTILEDMGLSTGLKFLFNDFRKYHNLEVQADVDDMEKTFSREHQILIYRIFQESLTNVTKHSEATKVTVAIKKQDGYVSFRMEDNGKGFDLQEVLKNSNKKRGVGLAALDERVRMMGGNLELWSHPGQGTRVHFTVPVDNPEV